MRKIEITPVASKRERREFVDLAYRLNASEPNWVPPLKMEAIELVTPGRNPFFAHADVELMLARENGRIVGRISAHIDHLALAQPPEQGMGPGTGNWGLLEAEDEEVAHLLIARAEEWLRAKGMTRVLAPLSLSIWEEPGQLVKGFDQPPTVMMGHQPERYRDYIEALGYQPAKTLNTYELDITKGFPPLIQRIIASGQPRLDGPLQLVQGGQGLIYRVPVFLPDQQYWGLISTVIDFDRLFAEVKAAPWLRDHRFPNPELPTMHYQQAAIARSKPLKSEPQSGKVAMPMLTPRHTSSPSTSWLMETRSSNRSA